MRAVNVAVSLIALVMVLLTSSYSWAYDYGMFNCDAVGGFAMVAFKDKMNGLTKKAALKKNRIERCRG